MVYHSSSDLLRQVICVSTLSSQVAGMLSSGDLKIIVGALQLSEILLQKMPEEFGVHFRREGVLHQVQKLTDPDNPISVCQYSESPLAAVSSSGWSLGRSVGATPYPEQPTGRTWTVASSSFANMFSDQLRRESKRREESSSSTSDANTTAGSSSGASGGASASAAMQAAAAAAVVSGGSSTSGAQPLRLSDMLKRKRVSKRSSGSSRKGRHSDGGANYASGSSSDPRMSLHLDPVAAASLAGSPPTMYDLNVSDPLQGGPSTPSRRSRLADRTSSLLSQLHPSRWVRSSAASHHDEEGSGGHGQRTSGSLIHKATVTSPATMAHSREKAKRWVREQASRFLESYFKESLGSRHPALTILRRLSAQVDHLARKPKDGERSLKEILSILHENDISPFEVTQSGLVPSLLTYLTTNTLDGHEEITRETRLRTFMHVFLGCPRHADSEESPDPESAVKFTKFVHKLNACANHLEQFPIKMHDMTSGSSGVKSAGSTLRFFKTHHLKCSLQRHPDCSSLKSWKGGLVKIDPLALVSAIEK